MSFGFRASEPADAAVIAELCGRVLAVPASSPVFSREHMHWKYWDRWPFWDGSRSFLLLADGRPVAHAGVVPLRCSIGGHPRTFAQLIDWAAEPRNVGAGVALLKRIAALADGAVSVRGSSMTQRLLRPIGFRPLGVTTQYAAPVRTVSVEPSLRLCMHERASFAAREHPLHAWESTPEHIVFQRSAAQLRAWLECPVAALRYGEVFDGERLIGTFLVCFTPRQARICDVWAHGHTWERVVRQAYRYASTAREDVTEIVCQTNDAMQAAALQACGFSAAQSDPLAVLASRELVADGAFVRHHLIDSDLAYLHHGEFEPWRS